MTARPHGLLAMRLVRVGRPDAGPARSHRGEPVALARLTDPGRVAHAGRFPLHGVGMAIAPENAGLFPGAAIMQPAFGWMRDLTRVGEVVDGVCRYARGR